MLLYTTQANIVRCETLKTIRNKNKEFLKANFLNSYIGYQLRNNVLNYDGDLVRDCHSILAMWKNHLSQLFNVHCVRYVRQTDIHTALNPEPSALSLRRLVKS
jgi:hypothetical protein